MEIPGIKSVHMEISDNCRKVQGGDAEAFDEAAVRLKVEYMKLVPSWPLGKRAKFHLILSVEYERKKNINIIVNGKQMEVVAGRTLSFVDIVNMACVHKSATVTYCPRFGGGCTIVPGQSVKPDDGAVISVVVTDGA